MGMTSYATSITVEDLETDPYPVYRRLREEAPVAWVPAVNAWLVTRAADVETVATKPELFTAEVADSPVDRSFGGPTLMTMDGERHLELRRSLDERYKPRVVATYIDDLVTPIAEEALASLLARTDRRADLLADYFEPISVLSLGSVLGVGHLSAEVLQDWFHGLAMGAINFENDPVKQAISDETTAKIDRELRPMMTRLREDPDDSTIASMLTSGCPVGQARTIDHVMPSLKVILTGGMQEPGHGAGSTLTGLLSDPGQFRALKSDMDGLMAQTIDEGLRWVAPIGTMMRSALCDTEVNGIPVPKGTPVSLIMASANRDEARFPGPDRFDIHRAQTAHMSFGSGAHFCAGKWFAKAQIEIALRILIDALPDMILAAPPEFRGWEFRAPTALHIHR